MKVNLNKIYESIVTEEAEKKMKVIYVWTPYTRKEYTFDCEIDGKEYHGTFIQEGDENDEIHEDIKWGKETPELSENELSNLCYYISDYYIMHN